MENTNVKSKKGLVIFLIIVIILLCIGLGLLLSGVVKNPFVKEKTCPECTKCDVKTKTETKKEETRYYQYKTESEKEDYDGNIMPRYTEIELDKDGTAKINYLRVNDVLPKSGIYVEDDKYIILTLNTDSDECYEGNYNAMIADSCTTTIILIKDKDTLKTQYGSIFHFEIDNANSSQEFSKVNKADLQTDLKN